MRKLFLMQDWFFNSSFSENHITDFADIRFFEKINLPHTVKEIPYNNFDETCYQFVSCYKKKFTLDKEYSGKKVFINFAGVMTYAEVFLNEHYIGEHKGGYTEFKFDISDYVVFGNSENILTVKVDSTERSDIPPFGGAIDYLTYGGIYRDVFLTVFEKVYFDNMFLFADNVLESEKKLTAKLNVVNDLNKNIEDAKITAQLLENNSECIATVIKQNISLTPKNNSLELIFNNLKNIKLWNIDEPNIYTVTVFIEYNKNKQEEITDITAFRTVEFNSNGFFLNGENIILRGLNRHQSFPYVGYALPRRAQERDAEILKNELGVNIVRTSHYPQSRYFLRRCCELGLLVFEEIPGWNYIGDKDWQDVACDNVKDMIIAHRNYPAIVLWGVRINESSDSSEFYKRTNEIARSNDPTRQTAGVRCIENSELHEDVYTMNEFTYGFYFDEALKDGHQNIDYVKIIRRQEDVTGLSNYVPYLVTEFAGHTYPTKRFDGEERLINHAKFHMDVHDIVASVKYICGALGWCAFDYNTHFEFGSGDRICYHGVSDMFRIPKFAGLFYSSQKSPDKEIVLEPLTRYTVGDRAIGGISPLVVCTNCDSISLKTETKDYGILYPCKEKFPHLPYPPVVIEDVQGNWGGDWVDATFTGYIDGKPCIEKHFTAKPVPTKLVLKPDSNNLNSYEPDCTRITVHLKDQCNNDIHFSDAIIKLKITGPAKIIGPTEFPLISGARAFWIKAVFKSGSVKIKATVEQFAIDSFSSEVTINVN
ncbi:MAG: beta-galactosidase [Treponema sp.]|nr:MAG: beta-galactosidase [Treponema sp.]